MNKKTLAGASNASTDVQETPEHIVHQISKEQAKALCNRPGLYIVRHDTKNTAIAIITYNIEGHHEHFRVYKDQDIEDKVAKITQAKFGGQPITECRVKADDVSNISRESANEILTQCRDTFLVRESSGRTVVSLITEDVINHIIVKPGNTVYDMVQRYSEGNVIYPLGKVCTAGTTDVVARQGWDTLEGSDIVEEGNFMVKESHYSSTGYELWVCPKASNHNPNANLTFQIERDGSGGVRIPVLNLGKSFPTIIDLIDYLMKRATSFRSKESGLDYTFELIYPMGDDPAGVLLKPRLEDQEVMLSDDISTTMGHIFALWRYCLRQMGTKEIIKHTPQEIMKRLISEFSFIMKIRIAGEGVQSEIKVTQLDLEVGTTEVVKLKLEREVEKKRKRLSLRRSSTSSKDSASGPQTILIIHLNENGFYIQGKENNVYKSASDLYDFLREGFTGEDGSQWSLPDTVFSVENNLKPESEVVKRKDLYFKLLRAMLDQESPLHLDKAKIKKAVNGIEQTQDRDASLITTQLLADIGLTRVASTVI